MNEEHGKEFGEMGKEWMGCMGMGQMHHWPKKMKKDFMMAMLRKKEKMLEAKLEFVKEMRQLTEKMEMEEPKQSE